jgi:hypothetical protein
MIHVKLPVLWFSDEQQKEFDLCNKDIPMEELDTKMITFYHIDYVRPYVDNHCVIASGGEIFIIKETEEVVNNKIQEQITYKWN